MDKDQAPLNPNGVAGKPLEPQVAPNRNAFNSLQAAVAPLAQPEKYNIQHSIDELHKEGPIQQLRTYESDIAELVKHKEVTPSKVVIEQQKKEAKPPEMRPEKEIEKTVIHSDTKSNIFLLLVSGLLVVAGLAALGTFLYALQKNQTKTPQTIVMDNTLITIDGMTELKIDPNQDITQAIANLSSSIQIPAGALYSINIVQGSTTATRTANEKLSVQELMTRMAPAAPSWLARSLQKDYVIGFFNKDGIHPFIILKTDSYENGYSGMLKWEATLATDIQPLLEIGSTTSIGVTYKDVVIKNKDVRELANGSREILLYSLPDKDTILITTDEGTLTELFSRLTTTKFTQ